MLKLRCYSPNILTFLVVVCVIYFFLGGVYSGGRNTDRVIRCYQCNSYYDPGCADWFNNATYDMVACPSNATMCRKIVQEAWYDGIWNRRYIRDCAVYGEVGADEGRWCTERIGTYRVKAKYCHCDNKDGCNSSAFLSLSVPLFVVTLFSAFFLLILLNPTMFTNSHSCMQLVLSKRR